MQNLIRYPIFESKVLPIYEDDTHFECIITPVEKNFSLSFSNMLRRIMMLYTIGTAVTAVQIKGVASEFENLPGVKEDTINILFNFKNLILHVDPNLTETQLKATLDIDGPKSVLAGHVILPTGIQILNPNLLICTLVEAVKLNITLFINSGIGYYNTSNLERGMLPLMGSFSPVEHVSYSVNSYSHYEETTFHIRTNGAVNAKQVFIHALDLLSQRSLQLLHNI